MVLKYESSPSVDIRDDLNIIITETARLRTQSSTSGVTQSNSYGVDLLSLILAMLRDCNSQRYLPSATQECSIVRVPIDRHLNPRAMSDAVVDSLNVAGGMALPRLTTR